MDIGARKSTINNALHALNLNTADQIGWTTDYFRLNVLFEGDEPRLNDVQLNEMNSGGVCSLSRNALKDRSGMLDVKIPHINETQRPCRKNGETFAQQVWQPSAADVEQMPTLIRGLLPILLLDHLLRQRKSMARRCSSDNLHAPSCSAKGLAIGTNAVGR